MMILPLEDRWGGLSVLEYEHGARETLLSLLRSGQLTFTSVAEDQRENFIRNVAAPYATQSFRQAKEFFRHAESSSWLVKPLLLYYGMLAATKASLTFEHCDFFVKKRSHGLSRGTNGTGVGFSSDTVTIRGSGVYPSARAALRQHAIPDGAQVPINEILRRLPDVVGSYLLYSKGAAMSIIGTNGPRVARGPLPTSPVRIIFDLPQSEMEANASLLPAELATDFDALAPENGIAFYASKKGWATEQDAQFEARRGFVPGLTPTLDNKWAFILPVQIEGKLYQLTEIELIYLVTFYFSEISRYSPHIWLQLHSGQENFSVLLCQDVLRACENKFLQLLNNRMIYAVLAPFTLAMPPNSTAP